MKITLKRISYEKYDEVLDSSFKKLLSNYEQIRREIEESCEPIILNGIIPEIEIDLEKYKEMINLYHEVKDE